MGLFEHWPYVNFHDLNLDWIIKEIPKVFASRDEAQASADASAESAAASQLSADAALASQEAAHQSELNAAQSATDAADSAQEAEDTVSNTLSQINLLQSRVDNIIPNGTQTEGNTELLDIRVADDGTTYDSAGNAVRAQASDLEKNIENNSNIIFSNDNIIASKTGHKAIVEDGKCKIIAELRNYWNMIVAPIETVYIDGTAKLLSGGLAGTESVNTPALVFIDKDYNVLGTPIYTAIAAPHDFNENDVPSGAEYVIYQFGGAFTFAFKSLSSDVFENKEDIKNLYEITTEYDLTPVNLTYENATGYKNNRGNFVTYSGVTIAQVSVTPGQEYFLKTRNYYDVAYAYTEDENHTLLNTFYLAGGSSPIAVPITIPANAAYLVIQRISAYEPTELSIINGLKAKAPYCVLRNKRLTLIGDSITETNIRAKTNWAMYLNKWCGAVVQNLGASGTGFIAGGNNPYSNRISRIDNPDIIGVALSFNDMNNSVEDLTTAANTFFENLIAAYPATPIICYVQSPWSAYHYGISGSDAWVNALKEVCNTKGIPFYDDLYKGCTLKPWIAGNRAVYYINDGEGSTGEEDWVHPNSEGHKVIARYLYTKFIDNIVAYGMNYQ